MVLELAQNRAAATCPRQVVLPSEPQTLAPQSTLWGLNGIRCSGGSGRSKELVGLAPDWASLQHLVTHVSHCRPSAPGPRLFRRPLRRCALRPSFQGLRAHLSWNGGAILSLSSPLPEAQPGRGHPLGRRGTPGVKAHSQVTHCADLNKGLPFPPPFLVPLYQKNREP